MVYSVKEEMQVLVDKSGQGDVDLPAEVGNWKDGSMGMHALHVLSTRTQLALLWFETFSGHKRACS
jgi:hypothetical protein